MVCSLKRQYFFLHAKLMAGSSLLLEISTGCVGLNTNITNLKKNKKRYTAHEQIEKLVPYFKFVTPHNFILNL